MREEIWVLMGNFTLFTMTLAISSKNEMILPGKGASVETVHFTILICITSTPVLETPQQEQTFPLARNNFFLLAVRKGREKEISLALHPPASACLPLKCVLCWTSCPLGQNPVPCAAESSQGKARMVINGSSLARNPTWPKIPSCCLAQLSLMRGNAIYFLGSLPSPEEIMSLECLSPERVNSGAVLGLFWRIRSD